jgi:glycine/D-amino acid oxidase-like deaminating enzyme
VGIRRRQIDVAELRRLLPPVVPGPVEAALFYPQEGTLDPIVAVEAVLARAKALGAEVHYPVEVSSVDIKGDRLRGVRTSQGDVAADVLVIAAGTGSQQLASRIGVNVPLLNSPGGLAHTAEQARLLERAFFAPGATVKQNPGGRIVSSSSYPPTT